MGRAEVKFLDQRNDHSSIVLTLFDSVSPVHFPGSNDRRLTLRYVAISTSKDTNQVE